MSNFISLESFLESVQRRDPSQPEFLQAVREVFSTLWPFLEKIRSTVIRICSPALLSRSV